MRVHVSGANGFVGQGLITELVSLGLRVTPWVRAKHGLLNEKIVPDFINPNQISDSFFSDCDVFVHLAARVHRTKENADEARTEYRLINYECTLALARAAARAGVKHFVFISSVKVNGEYSENPLHESDQPKPLGAYGEFKWLAEQSLHALARETDMLVTIIRPPLIYGPGVGANFLTLIKWLYYSMPVPLRLVSNKRSFVYLGNLINAVVTCIKNPPDSSHTFFVSDDSDLTTHELCKKISLILGVPLISVAVPPKCLKFLARLIGKQEQMNRLQESLQVKIDSIRLELKWTPPFTVSQGLADTVEWYKKKNEIERKKFLKRILDLFIASFATVLLFIPMMIVALLVKITSVGPILYWSERVGAGNITFKMPKFRTMRLGTPVVATHLLTNPSAYLTPIGNFLRMTSLDELPQILCIFQGSMSWVGPRPALYNQLDLISLRTNLGVHQLIPGVTGLAQVNGRDELDIPTKVQYDKEYLMNQSLRLDIKILILTIVKVLKRQNINH